MTAVSGSDIGAGASKSFNARLEAQNPLVTTTYTGTYRLTFSDNTSGLSTFASDSVGKNYVDITLTAAVPEPKTYAMFLAGLLAVGFLSRKRRDQRE